MSLRETKRMIDEGAPVLGPLFLLDILAGHPPAIQKGAILYARSPQVRLITDQQAEILIRELGLINA